LCEDGIHISAANKAFGEMFGYLEREIIGKTLQEVLQRPNETAEISMDEQIRRTLAGETLVTEGVRIGKNEKPLFVSIINLPRPGEKDIDGCYYSYLDLTNLKQQEERLQKNLDEIKKAFRQTVEVLSATTEARDPYTAGHQERVAALSVAIAKEMGQDEVFCEGIYLAAMVHDIGKIAIPAEILSKPTRLSKIEMALIQTHCKEAFEILRRADFPWRLAKAALQHHERLDGSGYPEALKGEEILLEARIIGVADTLEAMSSHRPYRPAQGIEAAFDEVQGHRGTKYDPEVVDACLKVFRRGFMWGEQII
jgi:putative nucleotidyltransferase with HDIG domain/PAS domain S-box-containing protein